MGVIDRGLDSFFESAVIKNKAIVEENIPGIPSRPKIVWLEDDDKTPIEKKLISNNPKYKRVLESATRKRWFDQMGLDMNVLRINDKKPYRYFYFDNEGHMVKNCTITYYFKKYTFDENGLLVK